MPQERLPMRNIRDALRLAAGGLSNRQIAASLSVSKTTVRNCLRRAVAAGLAWPLPEELTDATLEARLYPPSPSSPPNHERPLPDWAVIHRELKRPGVTLLLLWQEHRAQAPDGYGYSQFCELYTRWKGRLSPTMRQTHVAGEKLFVDYAGTTIDVVDAATGEVHACQLFVAALGASSLTYAEATRTQTLTDWIGSHTRAFVFFGGVSGMVVSDNLKSGVTKACFYEPEINRTYAAMAEHYGTAIVPARPRKPRDKAKVESAVLLATRWIIARLRNRHFFTLAELNEAIRVCVDDLNTRNSRHLGTSRRALFEDIERPALKPLPAEPFEYAEWKQCRAGLDYHVEIQKHYYSVPSTLLKERLWARITARTVEVFHNGKRVASHVRSSSNRQHTTIPEHMPSSHRRYADFTPSSLRRRAAEIGASTSALVDVILRERTHPEQGFRACIGIVGLAKSYGPERLEAACARALEIGARSFTSVKSILETKRDRRRPEPATDGPAIVHDNIRGPSYFH
jgi:transposase